MTAAKRTAFRTCPLCEATCGLTLSIEGDEVRRVRGDRDDVFSAGYLCPKGVALGELHHDPDRLTAPLIREGDTFREVSWSEAFERVETGLRPWLGKGARDNVAAYLGNPNVHTQAGSLFMRPLLKALSTRKLFTASTVDQIPKHVASGVMFGDPAALPVPDIDRLDYILMLGANPWESNGSLWTAPDLPGRLRRLRKRGGRLVVVDPRRTRTAANADQHLAIRPGSDAHWLLALAWTLLDEDLATPGRLESLTRGLEDLPARLEAFSPEAVAPLCDIPAATTRAVARELAASKRAAVYARIGAHANRFGTLAAWATELLNLLTGNLDREGGVMFPIAPHDRLHDGAPGGKGFSTGRWHSRVSGYPEVMGELPAACLAEEIASPGADRIRALVTVAGNPVLSTPAGHELDRALQDLDFMVSVDLYLNETTRHADVILPPPSPLERSHYDHVFMRFAVRSVANYSPPVFEGDGPDEAEILMRLALIARGEGAASDTAALEQENLAGLVKREVANPASPIAECEVEDILSRIEGDNPCDRVLDLLLRTGPFGDGFTDDSPGLSLRKLRDAPHGIDFGAMQSDQLPARLRTPGGHIELESPLIDTELAAATKALEESGIEGELLLIGRREFHSNNSWLHNLPSLIERPERCTLRMHADDAERLGLGNGDPAEIRSGAGKVEALVEIHEEMRPGVVSLPHGYGHHANGIRLSKAAQHAGVNANELVEMKVDAASGNAVLNGVPVAIRAA